MSMETLRQLLEELDVLEQATAQRFRKNPFLGPAAGVADTDSVLESRAKRPHKETLLQQHELRFFGDEYRQNCDRVRAVFDSDALTKEAELLKDPSMKFSQISALIGKINAKHEGQTASAVAESYRLYLSAPLEAWKTGKGSRKVQRKYFLSAAAAHIDELLGAAFAENEMYGKYIDLSAYYEMYKVVSLSQLSYVDYLRALSDTKAASPDYVRYLESLLAYLIAFYKNVHPMETFEFPKEETAAPEVEDGKPNEAGEVYCKACDKLFAKESVYKGHLDGKKHKKNAKAVESNAPAPKVDSGRSLEHKVKYLVTQLQPIVTATISDHDRRKTLSDRELALEVLAVRGEESDYTDCESGSEHESEDEDDTEYFSKDLPLGTDGIPIPLWLYKLQGLHREYLCEICGNSTYKGRQQYTKHFGLPKHAHGLMCLGIAELDVPLFANISTIAEAQDLWKTIQSNKRKEKDEEEDAIEIEDEDGNVMSHKDYVELKKQGLL